MEATGGSVPPLASIPEQAQATEPNPTTTTSTAMATTTTATFSTTTSALPVSNFPKLAFYSEDSDVAFDEPVKRINEGADVVEFLVSQAYRDLGTFLLQLNHAVLPREGAAPWMLDAPRDDPPPIRRLQRLLAAAGALIDEVPPDPGPRRFGNVSFRRWHALLDARVDDLLKDLWETDDDDRLVPAGPELRAYLTGGFGSAERLDYGTGHELSFVAFLGGLWKLAFFRDLPNHDEEVERAIVLGVVEPYLQLVRRLILTYTLEPAGSHGVWGLDDHAFVPYIFGSAQLAAPVGPRAGWATPQSGSAPHAPRTGDVLKPAVVAAQRTRNMYFSAVAFIGDVKRGPFWEHSPILFDVSGIRDGWGKINKGMLKMYHAEVLAKFPVVQHFPFGALFPWTRDPAAAPPPTSVHMANQPAASHSGPVGPGAFPHHGTTTSTPPVPPADSGLATERMPAPSQTTRPGAGAARAPTGGRGTTAGQTSITRAPWAK